MREIALTYAQFKALSLTLFAVPPTKVIYSPTMDGTKVARALCLFAPLETMIFLFSDPPATAVFSADFLLSVLVSGIR